MSERLADISSTIVTCKSSETPSCSSSETAIEGYWEVQSPALRGATGSSNLQTVRVSTDILHAVTYSGYLCRGIRWNC